MHITYVYNIYIYIPLIFHDVHDIHDIPMIFPWYADSYTTIAGRLRQFTASPISSSQAVDQRVGRDQTARDLGLISGWIGRVYGRYNELVHGDYFMVYKPTYPLVN